MVLQLNYNNSEIVSSPTIIVSGKTTTGANGIIEFVNNQNQVFPPQYFEVNGNGHFKALVHVSPNANVFDIKVISNGRINPFGFADYGNKSPEVADSGQLTIQYYPLNNKPVHLCVVVGKDSNGSYDMPKYRLNRGEVANLDTAIRKLKIAGRIMQAYTQDEMRTTGFSNRCFPFVEENTDQQGLFGYNVKSPQPHLEVKVHVLRSPRTVAELRDPNWAQQNPKATKLGALFDHAIELIQKSDIFLKRPADTAVQCAVLYLDSTYDVKNDLILTHAALGGGNANVKLAIFGSHGLHSWPINFPMITPSFLDSTHLSKNEVANDCNQCGTSWECLNITLGAFMHEIGHHLGCPHQVNGVMLRDYIWFNRAFMTRELECLRTHSNGEVIPSSGQWAKYCHWHILDKLRFLFHGSFALPTDANDKTMGQVFSTTPISDKSYGDINKAPTLYNVPSGGCIVKSESGIFLVEVITKDLARFHIPYFPTSYGGHGLQKDLMLDYQYLFDQLRANSKEVSDAFDVRVLSLGGDLFIKNFKQHCNQDAKNTIRGDFGLGKGTFTAYKSSMLGNAKDHQEKVIGFDVNTVTRVRVYHGGALDGVRIFFKSSDTQTSTSHAPPIPKRNYMAKLTEKMSNHTISSSNGTGKEVSVLLGNEKSHYTDINVPPGEKIAKFHFRNGAWIDAIQVEFSSGRKSEMLGNAGGGHLSTLEPPGHGYTLVGMFGYLGSWLDGLGIIYTNEL